MGHSVPTILSQWPILFDQKLMQISREICGGRTILDCVVQYVYLTAGADSHDRLAQIR